MDCIILMGIKHCGKSTQAKLLSQRLGVAGYDTDELVCGLYGKSPRELYTEGGPAAFKDAEARVCRTLAADLLEAGTRAVIATGGGICCNGEALAALRPLGMFVFLSVPEDAAADRIVREAREREGGGFENLPAYIARKSPRTLLEIREIFHGFYEERTALYSKAADIRIEMGRAGKEENAEKIAALVGRPRV